MPTSCTAITARQDKLPAAARTHSLRDYVAQSNYSSTNFTAQWACPSGLHTGQYTCSMDRAAASGQLVTSSAGILVEIMPGYDVIAGHYLYNARWCRSPTARELWLNCERHCVYDVRSRRRHCILGTAPVAGHIPHPGPITCLNARQTMR